MIINVIVAEKRARAEKHEPLVCGNSDYIIDFTFDAEWDKYQTKTARFIFDDRSYIDVVFNGTQCPVPVLKNTHDVIVGVYAGDLKTTTPAYLHAQRSILCDEGAPADPDPDVYAQIMELLNKGGVTPEQIQQAVDSYLTEHPLHAEETDPTVPDWAKQPTKPSYTADEVGAQPKGDYALKSDIPDIPDVPVLSVNGQTGDVTLNASDVGALPANTPIPKSLPSPHPIVINGVAYDGSERVEIKAGEYELIETITLTEEVVVLERTTEPDGKAYSFQSLYMFAVVPKASASGILYAYTNDRIAAPMNNAITSNFDKGGVGQLKVDISHGFMDSYGVGAFNQDTSANKMRYVTMYNVPTGIKAIKKLVLRATADIPVGTVIKIWGVRTDA